MNILAYIPARSGSKSIKNKNLEILEGYSLLELSVRYARHLRSLGKVDDVFLSTDSTDYLDSVSHLLSDFSYIRPVHLACDQSATVDGIIDAIIFRERQGIKRPDYVLILQPTTPFRTFDDADELYKLFYKVYGVATCVTSLARLYDHHPRRLKCIDTEGRVLPISQHYHEPDPSRRQDLSPPVFVRNGAFYLTSINTIMGRKIRGDNVYGVVMSPINSLNIDEPLDLTLAKAILVDKTHQDSLRNFREMIEMYNGERAI